MLNALACLFMLAPHLSNRGMEAQGTHATTFRGDGWVGAKKTALRFTQG